MFAARGLAIALLVAISATALAAEEPWVEVRSPNFTVLTDAGEKRGREVALRFEQMRHVFGQLILKEKVNIAVPLQIIAFRNTKRLRDYVPLWNGKPVKLAGLFVPGEDRQFILIDLSALDAWRVAFHEYGHQLLNANFPETAPWFDEGLAEYYSTIRIGNNQVVIGESPESSVYVLTHSRLMPLLDLFTVRRDAKIYNEQGDRRELFYAQSWLVVHYLISTNKLKQAARYFELVNHQKVSPAEAIPRAFGMEPKQLEKELNWYPRSPQNVHYTIPLQTSIKAESFEARVLDPLDAQAILADLHLHSRDHQERAVTEFQGILAQRPNHAAAHRGLGYAYLRRGIFDKAGEHFRKAAESDSKDPRVHYFSALLMNRMSEGRGVTGSDEVAGAMKRHLEAAVALDPSFADAHMLLAIAYDALGEPQAALERMIKACDLAPRNDMYALNLGRAYARVEKWNEAKALLQRLTASKDQMVASNAATYLQTLEHWGERGTGSYVERVSSQGQYTPEAEWGGPAPQRREEDRQPAESPVVSAPSRAPIKYLQGTLVSVDCSAPPEAALTIKAGARTWRMLARNAKQAIIIGADQLSCDWKNVKIGVNYREGGKLDADLVSLELK